MTGKLGYIEHVKCGDCVHVLERGKDSTCLTCCHGRLDKFEKKEEE